jgi:hypothetical protein
MRRKTMDDEIAAELTAPERDALWGILNSRRYVPAYDLWVSLEDRGLIGLGPRPDLVDPTPLGRAVWHRLFVPAGVREANARFARRYAEWQA